VPAVRAVAARALVDSRARTLSFALLFAAVSVANVVGYRKTYPTLADRLHFARGFGTNKSLRLFFGEPHDLVTVGGFAAWRVGGLLSIFAAMWGLLAAVRALRAEEDAGRLEIVLAGALTRRTAFLAALAAIFTGGLVLWLVSFVAFTAARLPATGSAYLALAIVAALPVFVGVGALASQLAPTRRVALELGSGVLAATFLLRVVADTSAHLGALKWATPLGWAEELRPFAQPRPAVLLLPLAASVVLLVLAASIAERRDVGSGLLQVRDSAEPNLRLLGSPTALAFRGERAALAGWLVGTGAFAFALGTISKNVSVGLSKGLREQLRKLGATSITTPSGYLSLTFLFFVFAVSLLCCSQIAAARREEAEEQLETVLALPVSRRSWLGGRLVLAAVSAAGVALAAGALAWAGAASQNARVSLPSLVEAGANCLPTAFLFLAASALAFAILPRASGGIAYGLTSLAFVWELLGSLLGAPAWLLDLSPFHHIGFVPAQPFRATAAGTMLTAAAVMIAMALWAFRRRDLSGP
jgi:ABC-2 type transport system permease protein